MTAWESLPAVLQDLATIAALLLPVVLFALFATLRYRTWALARALISRHRGVAASFVVLIGVAVGLGTAVLVQERGLRAGSAGAADRFDLVIAAPGSDVTALLAAVYLQAADLPLLSGELFDEIARDPSVELAAPLAFGDSVAGVPIVGTTREFVEYLTGEGVGRSSSVPAGDGADDRATALSEGRFFTRAAEAVIGSDAPFGIGERLLPSHGVGESFTGNLGPAVHANAGGTVTGRLRPTGTPWDRAVIVPVESVWMAHGLGDGHAIAATGPRPVGPPYDASVMPGVPAVVIRAKTLGATYALRSRFSTARSMAFFPGEVLSRLFVVLGDVRRIVSLLTLVTQVLVVTAIVTALAILMRGFSRRFAMLRAIGAPRGFVFALVWLYGTVLVGAGALLGLVLGGLASLALARWLSATTRVRIDASWGTGDFVPVAGFVLAGAMLAAWPAWRLARRGIVADLRA